MKKKIILFWQIFFFLHYRYIKTTFIIHNKEQIAIPNEYLGYPQFVNERLNSYNKVYKDLPINTDIIFNPIDLICWWRFDLMAKYIYAKFHIMGVQSDWGKEVYKEHLNVWANLAEWDKTRSSLDEYIDQFHNVLDSIKKNGFDPQSKIRIDNRKFPCEGAHRIIASLLYDKKVVCYYTPDPYLNPACQATATFFKERDKYVKGGLKEKYLDNMALYYCELKKNTRIVIIFPSIFDKQNIIKKILRSHGNIIYHKSFLVNGNGILNFVGQLYPNQSKYIKKKKQTYLFRVFMLEPHDPENQLIPYFNIPKKLANYQLFCYLSKNNEDTLRLARTCFVRNSIDFLNNVSSPIHTALQKKLKILKQWLNEHNLNQSLFCVDTDEALFNNQTYTALPILHFNNNIPTCESNMLTFSNNKYNTKKRDDILFNPNYHFYYQNIKFKSLNLQ